MFIFILFDDMQFYRLSVPVCYLSSYFNLDLFRILVDYQVDYVVDPRFEEELALIEERHSSHDHLHKGHPIFQSLRNNYRGVGCRSCFSRDDCLARCTKILCGISRSKVDGGIRHCVVDIDCSIVRNLTLEILSFDQPAREFAQNVSELKIYRIWRSLDPYG